MSLSKNALQKLANDKIDIVDTVVDGIDTVVDSIETKVDVIDGLHDVPSVNSINNVHMRDVIGNKTDSHSGGSISSKLNLINEHLHGTVFLYPELAGYITLTKAAGAWAAFPLPTEIIPENTIAFDFDLHFLDISNISANGEYAISLYTGASGAETRIGCYGAARTAAQSQEGSRPILTRLISANTRISASISSSNAAADTLIIKVEGHTY